MKDPDFLAFKIRLLGAIQRNDARSLTAAVAPDIRTPMTAQLWKEVAAVLRLGSVKDEEDFIAPYVFMRFPHTLDR